MALIPGDILEQEIFDCGNVSFKTKRVARLIASAYLRRGINMETSLHFSRYAPNDYFNHRLTDESDFFFCSHTGHFFKLTMEEKNVA